MYASSQLLDNLSRSVRNASEDWIANTLYSNRPSLVGLKTRLALPTNIRCSNNTNSRDTDIKGSSSDDSFRATHPREWSNQYHNNQAWSGPDCVQEPLPKHLSNPLIQHSMLQKILDPSRTFNVAVFCARKECLTNSAVVSYRYRYNIYKYIGFSLERQTMSLLYRKDTSDLRSSSDAKIECRNTRNTGSLKSMS
jgi:hypothetical protein